MDLSTQLNQELKQLAGFSSSVPKNVQISDATGLTLNIAFVAVDTMSCAFESLSLQVPELVGHEVRLLNQWAKALSQRVTYLLEHIGPIEIDPSGSQVLIRSTPPDLSQGVRHFYEVLLSAQSNGTFLLRRFRSETGQPGRKAVDILLTNQTLMKLVNDLVETIPDAS